MIIKLQVVLHILIHILYTDQPEKALKITAVFGANYMDHTLLVKARFLNVIKRCDYIYDWGFDT